METEADMDNYMAACTDRKVYEFPTATATKPLVRSVGWVALNGVDWLCCDRTSAGFLPHQFPGITSAVWWGLVTLTSVGYGDLYPNTAAGKFMAGIAAISGVLIVAVPLAIVARKLSDVYEKEQTNVKLEEEKPARAQLPKIDDSSPKENLLNASFGASEPNTPEKDSSPKKDEKPKPPLKAFKYRQYMTKIPVQKPMARFGNFESVEMVLRMQFEDESMHSLVTKVNGLFKQHDQYMPAREKMFKFQLQKELSLRQCVEDVARTSCDSWKGVDF